MILKIKNKKGDYFTVRLILKGDRYGFNNCLVHDNSEPLVEFYDAEYGQFVSSYYRSTLLNRDKDEGLILYGGVPKWVLDGKTMNEVIEWLSPNSVKFIKEMTK